MKAFAIAREWIQDHYVDQGLTYSQCGTLLGCSPCKVGQHVRKLGMAGVRRGGRRVTSRGGQRLADPKWLREAYTKKGIRQIASELSCTTGSVLRYMENLGIPRRTVEEGRALALSQGRGIPLPSENARKLLRDPTWLAAQYLTRSTRQIAEELGCGSQTVRYHMARMGMRCRSQGDARQLLIQQGRAGQVAEPGLSLLRDKEWMRQQYARRSPREIAQEIGCCEGSVSAYLRGHGIPARPKPIKTTGFYAGRYWDSFYEAAVAAWLDSEGLTFEYHPGPYRLDGRSYTPDFFVPSLSEWWEVGDAYTDQKTRTLALWNQSRPGLPLIIIDRYAMREMGAQFDRARELYSLPIPDPIILAA